MKVKIHRKNWGKNGELLRNRVMFWKTNRLPSKNAQKGLIPFFYHSIEPLFSGNYFYKKLYHLRKKLNVILHGKWISWISTPKQHISKQKMLEQQKFRSVPNFLACISNKVLWNMIFKLPLYSFTFKIQNSLGISILPNYHRKAKIHYLNLALRRAEIVKGGLSRIRPPLLLQTTNYPPKLTLLISLHIFNSSNKSSTTP